MPKSVYECLFLFDANKYAREAGKVAATVTNILESNSAEILVSRLWREDRLAYPVQGHRKGAYWLTYFRMDCQNIKALNRACEINEDILRHLVIKIDARLVEPLVAHARGERAPADSDEGNGSAPADGPKSEGDKEKDRDKEKDKKAAAVGS